MKTKTNNTVTQKTTSADARPERDNLKTLFEALGDDAAVFVTRQKDGDTRSTEQKLLDCLFRPDAPDGPGKTTVEYPEIRVTDYLEKAGKKYKPGIVITLGDFEELEKGYARRVLAGIVEADVRNEGQNYAWYGSEKYAPHVLFEVDEGTAVRHEECGWFLNPVKYHDAGRILPKLGFRTNGIDEDTMVAWGIYSLTEDGEYCFHVTDAADATDIMLIVPWGGAHSQTRGRDNNPTAKYFEKCASKKGGEGYDFHIVGVKGMQNELFATECDLTSRYVRSEVMFFAKCLSVKTYKRDYDEFQETREQVFDEVEELQRRITAHPLSHEPYVFAPDFGDIIEMSVERPLEDYDLSFEELHQEISDEKWSKLLTLADKAEITVRAWEKFAPRYNELCQMVTSFCCGWAEIYEDFVKVWLPNNADSDEPIVEHRFAFSEAHLQKCMGLIRDFMTDEVRCAQENDQALDELRNRAKELLKTLRK